MTMDSAGVKYDRLSDVPADIRAGWFEVLRDAANVVVSINVEIVNLVVDCDDAGSDEDDLYCWAMQVTDEVLPAVMGLETDVHRVCHLDAGDKVAVELRHLIKPAINVADSLDAMGNLVTKLGSEFESARLDAISAESAFLIGVISLMHRIATAK